MINNTCEKTRVKYFEILIRIAANFCPRRELREKTLERALKTYIVIYFCDGTLK